MKQKLYKRNQNNTIGFVEIITRKVRNKDNEYDITINKGILNSSKISSSKKNILLKNKTLQDILDRHVNEFCNKGYDTNLSKIQNVNNNTFGDGSIMPMLLNPAVLSKVKYPCYVQKKYDGMRCIAEVKNDKLVLKTRENNIITLNHISDAVNYIFNNEARLQFDGEIYYHGVDLGDMISVYKSGTEEDKSNKLKYVIYDIPDATLSFEKRRNLLMAINNESSSIIFDYGKLIETEEELLEFHKTTLSEGYEGTIICDKDATYTPGYRSNSKTKFKPLETKEFKCIGHYYNKGKMSKQSTLICETEDNRSFHVKMKGTSEQREQYAKEFEEKFLNKMVTVEYRKLSKYGVPIEGRGICVRDYE